MSHFKPTPEAGELVGPAESFWDRGQYSQIIKGLNSNARGVRQTYDVVGEAMGFLPHGTTEYDTIMDRRNFEELDRITTRDKNLPGAGYVEGGTSLVTAAGLPFGVTKVQAALFGAGAGAMVHSQNPGLGKEALHVGGGAGLGYAFRSIFKGPAQDDLRRATQRLEKKAFVGPPRPTPAQLQKPQGMQPGPNKTGLPPFNPTMHNKGGAGGVPRAQTDALRQQGIAANRGVMGQAQRAQQGQQRSGSTQGFKGVQNTSPVTSRASVALQRQALRKAESIEVNLTAKLARLEKTAKSKKIKGPERKALDAEISKTKQRLAVGQGIIHKIKTKLGDVNKTLNPGAATRAATESKAAAVAVKKKETALKAQVTRLTNQITRLTDSTKALVNEGTVAKLIGAIKKLNPEADVKNLPKPALVKMLKKETAKAKKAVNKELKATIKQIGDKPLVSTKAKVGLGLAALGISTGAAASGGEGELGAGAIVGLLGAGALLLLGGRAGAAGLKGFGARVDKRFKNTPYGKKINKVGQAGMRDASRSADDHAKNVNKIVKLKEIAKQNIADVWAGAGRVLDKYLGSIHTRLLILSPQVAHNLNKMEWKVHAISGSWMETGDKAFKLLKNARLTSRQAEDFDVLLMNDSAAAIRYLKSHGHIETARAFQATADSMAEAEAYLGTVGLGQNMRKGFMPRQVDDTEFFNIPEVKTYFDQLKNQKGVALTEYEQQNVLTDLINNVLAKKGDIHFGRAAKSLQQRKLRVTRATLHAYASPQQAYNNYAQEIARQVERRKFFKGMGVQGVDDLGPNGENIEGIASKLAEQLRKGSDELTDDQVNEIAELIRARFGPGEQAPSRAVQNFKNWSYAGLLGNPMAAATQAGDIALSAYKNGIWNTARAMVETIAGKGKMSGLDKKTLLGLRDVAADFQSKVSSRDTLEWALNASGFKMVDRWGKNVFITAAMHNNQQMGKAAFVRKWRERYDPEGQPNGPTPRTEKLWEDVQNFERTGITDANREDLGLMMWNELSGAQPIGLSSLPQAYLENPNGRAFYMLQTFTLKLFDIMRRDIVQQIAAKNYAQAARNATKLTTLFVGMNGGVDAAKNFVTGKTSTLPDLMMNNLFKMWGANQFMMDTAGRQGLGAALSSIVMPPMALIDAAIDPKKAVGLIPIIGRNAAAFME